MSKKLNTFLWQEYLRLNFAFYRSYCRLSQSSAYRTGHFYGVANQKVVRFEPSKYQYQFPILVSNRQNTNKLSLQDTHSMTKNITRGASEGNKETTISMQSVAKVPKESYFHHFAILERDCSETNASLTFMRRSCHPFFHGQYFSSTGRFVKCS